MATKNDTSYFTLEKYECYWEDSILITNEWKDIEDAKKNMRVIDSIFLSNKFRKWTKV